MSDFHFMAQITLTYYYFIISTAHMVLAFYYILYGAINEKTATAESETTTDIHLFL